MKFNKPSIFIALVSLFLPASVFAIDPIEINPELLQIEFEPLEGYTLFDDIEPTVPFTPEDTYIDDSSIYTQLRGQLNADGTVFIDWGIYDRPDFMWYKVLRSHEDKDLVYPQDDYIEYFEDPYHNYYDDLYVPLGSNYYRICIITNDFRRGCSNHLEIFKGQHYPLLAESTSEPEPYIYDADIPGQEAPLRQPSEGGVFSGLMNFFSNNIEIIIAVLALFIGITGYSLATKKKRRSISKYMTQIDNTYAEFKMKSKRCEAELYRLRDIVDEELKSGKLDEGAYQLLMNRIEGYMVEIQKQIVNEKFGGLPANLKNELFQMMEDGEITEGEYEKFQMLINKSELSGTEQSTLLKTVKDFQKQGESLKRKH